MHLYRLHGALHELLLDTSQKRLQWQKELDGVIAPLKAEIEATAIQFHPWKTNTSNHLKRELKGSLGCDSVGRDGKTTVYDLDQLAKYIARYEDEHILLLFQPQTIFSFPTSDQFFCSIPPEARTALVSKFVQTWYTLAEESLENFHLSVEQSLVTVVTDALGELQHRRFGEMFMYVPQSALGTPGALLICY